MSDIESGFESESGLESESGFESDCSIYNEIEELIATTVQQQLAYEESIKVLEAIKELIDTNINVTYNNKIVDFDDVIDQFHSESLKSIDESGNIIFGQLLMEFLNKID